MFNLSEYQKGSHFHLSIVFNKCLGIRNTFKLFDETIFNWVLVLPYYQAKGVIYCSNISYFQLSEHVIVKSDFEHVYLSVTERYLLGLIIGTLLYFFKLRTIDLWF